MSEAWNIRFGTAGTSDSFAAQGYKSSLDVPEYTAKMGLNAFEYQCGRGVRLGLDKAARMAALAAQRMQGFDPANAIPAEEVYRQNGITKAALDSMDEVEFE